MNQICRFYPPNVSWYHVSSIIICYAAKYPGVTRIQGIHVKCKVSKYFDILITGYKMSTFKILNSSNLWQKMEQQAHWRLPYFTFKSSRYLHNIYRVSHKSVLTLFLPFSRTKFIQNAKVGGVLKNSGICCMIRIMKIN